MCARALIVYTDTILRFINTLIINYYLYAGADCLKPICRSEVGDSRSISPAVEAAKLCRSKVPVIMQLQICVCKSPANMQTGTIFVAVVVSPGITQAMWLIGLKAQTNYITVVVASTAEHFGVTRYTQLHTDKCIL